MTVFLTDENKVIYGMYRWLRQNACDVDIVTLRQICIYIACGNDKFNFSSDFLNSINAIPNSTNVRMYNIPICFSFLIMLLIVYELYA